MSAKLENQYGTISIENEVIARIAGLNEDKISIDLHIIVEYGTNITAIAENIISTVKYKVETVCGIEVEQVNVFVEGVRVDG